MTETTRPKDIVPYAITSPQAFCSLYPELEQQYSLSDNNAHTFVKSVVQSVSEVVMSKSSQPIEKFYSIYLLLKLTSLQDKTSLITQLAQDDDLLAEIFRIAQTDLTKEIPPTARGRDYFGKGISREEMQIGMNFVRLCYETLLHWGTKYGSPVGAHPLHIYHFMAESLKKKGKLPFRMLFIEKNYDLAFNIAVCDFKDVEPPIVERNDTQKQNNIMLTASFLSLPSENDTEVNESFHQYENPIKVQELLHQSKTSVQKSEKHVLERKARLESSLASLKIGSQLLENKSKASGESLGILNLNGNNHLDESFGGKTQTITESLNGSCAKFRKPEISRLEESRQEGNGIKGSRRSKGLEKDLQQIQMSIKSSSNLKTKTAISGNVDDGWKPLLSELTRKEGALSEERMNELKSIIFRLGKTATFGKAFEPKEPQRQSIQQKGRESVEKKESPKNEQAKKLGNQVRINIRDTLHFDDVHHLDTKSSLNSIPSVEGEKTVNTLERTPKAKKYDPFSKVPIPDQRIPDPYVVKQVVFQDEQGKMRRSILATRDPDCDGAVRERLTIYEKRISELEREAFYLKKENNELKMKSGAPSMTSIEENLRSNKNMGTPPQNVYSKSARKGQVQSSTRFSLSTSGI